MKEEKSEPWLVPSHEYVSEFGKYKSVDGGYFYPVVHVYLEPGGQMPEYKTAGAAGMDLYARLEQIVTLRPGDRRKIPLGVRLAIPPGWELQIRPRSGLSDKGVWCAFGTVDSDYRGEVAAILLNVGASTFTIENGERIAQGVLAPVTRAVLARVERPEGLGSTARGEGGFGSTGR